MTPPIELREPAEDELDLSYDSSIGRESEVEIVGPMGPSITSSPMKGKKWAVSKVPMYKALVGAMPSHNIHGYASKARSNKRR